MLASSTPPGLNFVAIAWTGLLELRRSQMRKRVIKRRNDVEAGLFDFG
jgi:hypothetical protein